MNRLKTLVGIFAFSLLVLALPAAASAQWRGNNGGYGRNNGYGNLQGTVRNLKDRARDFERTSDRRDDRWNDRNGRGYYGQNLEDLADRFKNAADDFADAYGGGRNLNNSADEARRLLEIGSQIDQALHSSRGDRGLENQWDLIQYDLRAIADVYGFNYDGGRRGGRRNNLPF